MKVTVSAVFSLRLLLSGLINPSLTCMPIHELAHGQHCWEFAKIKVKLMLGRKLQLFSRCYASVSLKVFQMEMQKQLFQAKIGLLF